MAHSLQILDPADIVITKGDDDIFRWYRVDDNGIMILIKESGPSTDISNAK